MQFRNGVDVGNDITVDELRREFDAVCIAAGAEAARDLNVPGRELTGVHFAMDFLTAQNRRLNGHSNIDPQLDARDRNVVIIGGGDTGSDCAGTCIRQGARSVRQFELLPEPPHSRAATTPWPLWPMMLRTSHAHEEGTDRDWSVSTTAFSGDNGRVQRIHAVRLETKVFADGRASFSPVASTEIWYYWQWDSPGRRRAGYSLTWSSTSTLAGTLLPTKSIKPACPAFLRLAMPVADSR